MKKYLVFEAFEENGEPCYEVRNNKRTSLGYIKRGRVGRKVRWVLVPEQDMWEGYWWTHECLSQAALFMASLEDGGRGNAQQAKVKTCPHCGSHKVGYFDSDNDICHKCRKWFPGS